MVLFFKINVVSPPVTLFMGVSTQERQNLFRWGWPEDVLFYIDKLPPSPVYLRQNPGQTIIDIPAEVIQDAAQLAKEYNQKASGRKSVYVNYTKWTNIKQCDNNKIELIEGYNPDEVHQILVKQQNKIIIDRLNDTKCNKDTDFKREREERDRNLIHVVKGKMVEDQNVMREIQHPTSSITPNLLSHQVNKELQEEENGGRETPDPTLWSTIVGKKKEKSLKPSQPVLPSFKIEDIEGTRTNGVEIFSNNSVYYNLRTCKGFIKKIVGVFGPYTKNIIILGAINRTIEDFKNSRNSHLKIFENIELLDHNNCIYTSVSKILEASQKGQINGMTYFIIIFCGALLNGAEKLLKAGLSPTKIIEYFKLGEKNALEILKSFDIEAPDVPKAVDKSFEHELFRDKFLSTAMPAKILYYSCAVSLESMILREEIQSISRGLAIVLNKKLSIDRWALLLRMAGINVVISEKGFDEYSLKNLRHRGIIPVTLENGFDALRVQKTIGAKPLLEFKCEDPQFYESVVANVYELKVENIAGDVYFALIQKEKADAKMIVIEDTTFKNGGEKVSKHLDASKNNGFVPGGGATELHIAHQLTLMSDKYAEKDEKLKIAIKTFAAAFETLPRILAKNLEIHGLSDLMQQLKEEHSKGRKNMGLSFKRDPDSGISDALQQNNYELLLAKKLGIQYALEAVECVLK